MKHNYNVEKIYEGVKNIIEDQLVKEVQTVSKEARSIADFDERIILLNELIEKYPLIAEQLKSTRITMINDMVREATKHLPTYVKYDEGIIIKARIELLRSTLDKYTIEELASLVRE